MLAHSRRSVRGSTWRGRDVVCCLNAYFILITVGSDRDRELWAPSADRIYYSVQGCRESPVPQQATTSDHVIILLSLSTREYSSNSLFSVNPKCTVQATAKRYSLEERGVVFRLQ